MVEGPSSPPSAGDPDPELARLAAKGQHRVDHDSHRRAVAAESRGDVRVRLALAAHYGSGTQRAGWVVLVLGVVTLVAAWLVQRSSNPLHAYGDAADAAGIGVAVIGGILAAGLVGMKASRGRVAREKAWIASLPFKMDGYIEALAREPHNLVVELAWGEGVSPPSQDMLRGLVGLIDRRATIEGHVIHTTESCHEILYPNLDLPAFDTKVVGYVHKLVKKVLLPLHRSHAIARVSLRH